MNDLDEAVGITNSRMRGPTGISSPHQQGFLFQRNQFIGLEKLVDQSAVPQGINDKAQIVGVHHAGGKSPTAFMLWNGKSTDLGTLGGPMSEAYAVNNNGDVVGDAYVDSQAYHAFIYTNGVMNDLKTLGGAWSKAYAINDSSDVVGTSLNGNGTQHPFLYSKGKMIDLMSNSMRNGEAHGVNNTDAVVGSAGFESFNPHAFIYQDGKLTDLGTLGGPRSQANAINNAGVVVGNASAKSKFSAKQVAFVFIDGRMFDLNAQVVNLSQTLLGSQPLVDAVAINSSGDILANDQIGNCYLLTPVK